MKKHLLSAMAAVAAMLAFTACSSDDLTQTVDTPTTGKAVSIELSTKPTTRTVYTDNGTDLKAQFEVGKDYITIFFRKGTSNITRGTYKLTCAGVNEAAGTATFTSSGDETLTDEVLQTVMASDAGLTDIHMILASSDSKPDFYKNYTNDLSTQDGTLADATAHMQRVTNHDMTNTDNYEWDATTNHLKLKNVDFNSNPELCTSILKVQATFPASAEVIAGDTPIDLYADGAYSKYTCEWGNANGATTPGEANPFTQAKVASVVTNADGTKTATSYVCFWPTTKEAIGLITVKSVIGDITYSGDYIVKHMSVDGASTLKGAKLYTMPVTLAGAKVVNLWLNDDAHTYSVGTTSDVNSTSDWLSISGNTLNVAANTTGATRSGTITFTDDGISTTYTIRQIEPKDFRGTYTYTTKVFAGTGALTRAADPYTFQSVTFGAPRTSGELTDADGTKHTNNIGITGLYGTAVLDACVEIDYDAHSVKFGVFLDARDGQGQQVNGKYVAFVPALATRNANAWQSPWKFDETELGDPDYTWAWYTVSNDFKQIMYYNRSSNNVEFSTVPQYSSSTMNQIVGIDVVLSSTDVFTHSTVSGYCQVYQVNAKGQQGSFFTKTADASTTTTSADDITAGGYTEK